MPFDAVSYAAGRKAGGGSGGDITTQSLTVTENGTYRAPAGKAYTPVSVNVPSPEVYDGDYSVTPTEREQTLLTDGKKMAGNVAVNPIPDSYIVPNGTVNIGANGTVDVAQYASAVVNVPQDAPKLQSKTLTVTDNGAQTVTPDSGYDGFGSVDITVNVPQLDTSDADATAANILSGKTAYVDGTKVTGTMPNGEEMSF